MVVVEGEGREVRRVLVFCTSSGLSGQDITSARRRARYRRAKQSLGKFSSACFGSQQRIRKQKELESHGEEEGKQSPADDSIEESALRAIRKERRVAYYFSVVLRPRRRCRSKKGTIEVNPKNACFSRGKLM